MTFYNKLTIKVSSCFNTVDLLQNIYNLLKLLLNQYVCILILAYRVNHIVIILYVIAHNIRGIIHSFISRKGGGGVADKNNKYNILYIEV